MPANLDKPISDVVVDTGKATKVKGKTVPGQPRLSFKSKPFGVQQTKVKTVRAGSGATLGNNEVVSVSYAVYNASTGKALASTYGKPAVHLELTTQLMKGLQKGLTGKKIGDRLLILIPSSEGFGARGNSQLGVGANDTLAFLMDIKGATKELTSAQGTAVKPKPGLPKVTAYPSKAASITVPKKAPPTKLVAQDLIKGTGPTVAKGQTIKVTYTGVIWRNGKKFDSSFDHGGQPTEFPIGVGQVIKGWDQTLVGQKVGSRVLLVVPPSYGYGSKGQSSAGIKGTDTLVFVVDILAAI